MSYYYCTECHQPIGFINDGRRDMYDAMCNWCALALTTTTV